MKEEKEAKKEEEEEVPEGFVEAVNEFYDSADIIFKCFGDIYSDYLRGKDVRAELKCFSDTEPAIYHLLKDTLLEEESIEWIDGEEIGKEKKEKIFEFKKRFSGLTREIIALNYEETLGVINPPTHSLDDSKFSEDLGYPIIELKLFSGGRKMLYLKAPSAIVYSLANVFQNAVKNCINEMKEQNIIESEIASIKEGANDVKKGAKEILEMIEEIEKKVKKK